MTGQRTRPILTAPDKPLAYLATLLDTTFVGNAEGPATARRHVEYRREVVVATASERVDSHNQLRAAMDERDAAAAAASGAGRAEARRHARPNRRDPPSRDRHLAYRSSVGRGVAGARPVGAGLAAG